MGDPRDTPAMRQYARMKRDHPGCVLLFRMGDFYETFDDDAVTISRALGLTLTKRTEGVPMAGLPYHQLDVYLARLVRQGFRVAVCDQLQDPKDAKGLVERGVTRVVTPGTLVDEPLLQDETPCVVAALFVSSRSPGVRLAFAAVEASTGEFVVGDGPASEVVDELARRRVGEVVAPELFDGSVPRDVAGAIDALGVPRTHRAEWHFSAAEGVAFLSRHFGVGGVEGFGLSADEPALPAIGAVLRYLEETQAGSAPAGEAASDAGPKRRLAHLRPPRREDRSAGCVLDAVSLRALEVERTIRPRDRDAKGDGSLVGLFLTREVSPRTAMGKRQIGAWLRRPLGRLDAINARQAAVRVMVEDRRLATEVRRQLDVVPDVARIGARVSIGRATPRDLVALGEGARACRALAECVSATAALAPLAEELRECEGALAALGERIARECVEAPPAHLREGGLIRDGVDADLDEVRLLQRDAAAWMSAYQERLIGDHNIPSLKVGYNKIFGYYIELPAAQARSAPPIFTRRQTLKNAERYVTPELKDFERKVMTAEERAIARETELYQALCDAARECLGVIQRFGDAVAALDACGCLAERAVRSAWTCPELTAGVELEVQGGRHPVLAELLGDEFVANDLALGGADHARLALLTGPNMGGKSTYIRQTALIALLAHAGSYVPATRARIGLVDRIFTRVGADDALHAGQSTFMVEMTESAAILNNCTERSLVVLDEIGRGTSTLDGLALAWAIVERLSRATGPRTLFATHYHELTAIEDREPGRVRNLRVVVREWPVGAPDAQIVFLHRIESGRADRSYGVHVARLAGIPKDVLSRARTVLDELEAGHAPRSGVRTGKPDSQMMLFREYLEHPVLAELRGLRLDDLTPLAAFDALRRMKELAEGSEPDAAPPGHV